MKYKYPPKITIGGHNYKITLVDGAEVDGIQSDRHVGSCSQTVGQFEIATRTKIGGHKTLEFINTTLLHEIVHAISDIYVVEMKEEQVEQIAQGLLQVLEQLDIRLIKDG